MRSIYNKIVPFIILGIAIVALVAGLILFSYLLILGAVVGVILFALTWLREKFFPSKRMTTYQKPPTQHQQSGGRTFEHDDKK